MSVNQFFGLYGTIRVFQTFYKGSKAGARMKCKGLIRIVKNASNCPIFRPKSG